MYLVGDTRASVEVLSISNCTASGLAGGEGAALYGADQVTISITLGHLHGNHASAGGAILLREQATLKMDGVMVQGNNATHGGALYLTSECEVEMAACLISNNSAVLGGGAIMMVDSTYLNMTYCNVSNNYLSSSQGTGGALFVQSQATVHMQNSHFEVCTFLLSPLAPPAEIDHLFSIIRPLLEVWWLP